MSLDKPQLLVGLAADLGEHIRRVGIAEPVGLIGRLRRTKRFLRRTAVWGVFRAAGATAMSLEWR